VGRYPPGVAFLTAGEEITQDMAAFLRKQDPARLFGLTDLGHVPCVREIKTRAISAT
jgi:hypothetical protein